MRGAPLAPSRPAVRTTVTKQASIHKAVVLRVSKQETLAFPEICWFESQGQAKQGRNGHVLITQCSWVESRRLGACRELLQSSVTISFRLSSPQVQEVGDSDVAPERGHSLSIAPLE